MEGQDCDKVYDPTTGSESADGLIRGANIFCWFVVFVFVIWFVPDFMPSMSQIGAEHSHFMVFLKIVVQLASIWPSYYLGWRQGVNPFTFRVLIPRK